MYVLLRVNQTFDTYVCVPEHHAHLVYDNN